MFKVPEAKVPDEPTEFEFEIGGEKYTVRRIKFLDMGQAEQVHGGGRGGVRYVDLLDVFGAVGTPAGDAVRKLSDEQFEALFDAWVDDSKVSPGESAASST